MNAIALMYHDVTPAGDEDSSGFPGRDAARYKMTPGRFAAHLDALERAAAGRGRAAPPVVLTFDDGGVSALCAAGLLEARGLRGWFFVTTDWIGRRGFLDPPQLRDLRARGHRIGSHSCSHPLRMGRWPEGRIADEWTRSRLVLSDLLGEAISAASVPGGDFTLPVAVAAGGAGFTTLFTSEPTTAEVQVGPVTVHGRYTVPGRTSPRVVAALAAGAPLPALQQALVWNAKKLAKRTAGDAYLTLRRLVLRHGREVEWGDREAEGVRE